MLLPERAAEDGTHDMLDVPRSPYRTSGTRRSPLVVWLDGEGMAVGNDDA